MKDSEDMDMEIPAGAVAALDQMKSLRKDVLAMVREHRKECKAPAYGEMCVGPEAMVTLMSAGPGSMLVLLMMSLVSEAKHEEAVR
jgi:predicted dinucleotide-utilizing enzyme